MHPVYVIIGAGCAGLFLFTPGVHRHAAGPALRAGIPRSSMLLLAAVAAGFAGLYFFDRLLFSLALLMAKIDLLAFGGGYTSVPLMFHEVVDMRGWLDAKTLLDGMALGQLTPGPIVITETFVGFLMKGTAGAVAATICVFFPSFLIMVLLSPQIHRLQQKRWFERFIGGILCSFVGLIASSVVHFGRNMEWSAAGGIIAVSACAALCARVPVPAVLAGGIIAGLVCL
jgi:chromate transporter